MRKNRIMKKSAHVILLLLIFSVVGNSKAESPQPESQYLHHRHGDHGKKEGHHRGIRLFHFRHHGKGHSKSHDHAHTHHGSRRHGDKGTSENNRSGKD